MWKPGIKVGPQNWKAELHTTQAQYCEVWYRVDWEDLYQELFDYLKEHHVNTGLHFWGKLDGDILPNIAYPDADIWKPSLELMKRNIDTAAKHNFTYVNIHVGSYALEKINLDKHFGEPLANSEVDPNLAEKTCITNASLLDQYAKERGILLVIETLPPNDPENWNTPEARLRPHSCSVLNSFIVEKLGKTYGIALNNDLSHTAAECITEDREKIWHFLLERTNALAPYTRLIHANTLRKPFNGTDSHDGITDEDFARNVFPSKQQFIALLSLFKERDDVWVVNEPRTNHEGNFFALQAIQRESI